jgi:hypothetical protein
LAGQDLLDFSAAQLLINAEINSGTSGLLARSVNKAYSQIISQLSARCQIAKELQKAAPTSLLPTDTRSQVIVRLVSILAIENILSRVAGIPDHLKTLIGGVHEDLMAIRNGQLALPDLQFESTTDQENISRTEIIDNSFLTLG